MTVDLADGHVPRLVGIAVPMRGAHGCPAKNVLAALLSGRTVELLFAGNPRIRHAGVLVELYAGMVADALCTSGHVCPRF